MKIGIIGCGNMGEAIVSALSPKVGLIVYDTDSSKIQKIVKKYKARRASDTRELILYSDIVIIAVKPQDIEKPLREIKVNNKKKNLLVISIAAGIPTSFIEERVGSLPVIRVMPNLAAKVKRSVSVLCKGRFAKEVHLKRGLKIFSELGECILLKERYLDLVTAVSGSGPGYIYYFLSCLQEAGSKLGFSPEVSRKLVLETAKGAIALVSENKDDFSLWVKRVASPGGTTQAALNYLKKRKFSFLITQALNQAYKRAKELARR